MDEDDGRNEKDTIHRYGSHAARGALLRGGVQPTKNDEADIDADSVSGKWETRRTAWCNGSL